MQLYHISLNNLSRRKAKMFFVLLGLIIGIATIVSVYGVVETMQVEMTRQVTEFGVNVVVTPDSGGLTFSYGGITLPEIMYDVEKLTLEDVAAIEALPSKEMIRIISPKLLGMEMLENGQRIFVVGANLQEEFLIKPWLRLAEPGNATEAALTEEEAAGNDPAQGETAPEEGKMDFETIDLARQDLEALNLSDQQILVGATLAASLGLQEGDVLTVGGQQLEVYRILMESGTDEDREILMNLSAAQSLLDLPGEITVIEMAVDYFLGNEAELLAEINRELPHTYVTSLRQETLRRDEMLTRLVRFGMSVSVIILFAGMLVVSLTMSNSVRERTREIGIFRALGFRKSHIAQLIMTEGVVLSLIGGMLGFVIGTAVARYAGPFLAGMDMVVPWRIDLFLAAMGLAVAIGLVSSLYPAYQAAKQDPVEALRFI